MCLHFVNGDLVFESVGPIGHPDIYDRPTRQVIVNDPTGATIHNEARQLGSHLPLSDGRLHEALQLSHWLTQARNASPPARLVLSGRIIEQAANWAGMTVPAFVSEHLSWAWAWTRIAGSLSRAGAAAVLRLPGADGTTSSNEDRETFLQVSRQILDDRTAALSARARPWEVLKRLDWLVEHHAAATELGDYLRELQQHLAAGADAAAWLDDLRAELEMRNRRAVRTRNLIVHGGPLVSAVADNVVGTQDTLASEALEWVVEGLGAERALDEVFAERRSRYTSAVDRLRTGSDPVIELPAGVAP